MIGELGVLALSIHTIPTQVMMVLFVIPMGFGVSLPVRVGATLPHNVTRAKMIAVVSYVISMVTFGIMAMALYSHRELVFNIFTHEDDVRDGCEEIWASFCIYVFLLSMFSITMGIAIALGLQWLLGLATVFFLWVITLPGAYYFAIVKGGGLAVVWKWLPPPYACLCAVLLIMFVRQDWDEIAAMIELREALGPAWETMPLRLATINEDYGT